MYKPILIFILLMILNGACIEEYTPDVSRNERLLIVDAGLTDDFGPHRVKLSYSKGINDISTEPAVGATVRIEEKEGNTTELTETDEGVYFTPEYSLKGETGKEYRLVISLVGEEYESDWMELKKPAIIDSLYWRRETNESINEISDGIQLYINSHNPDNNARYYRWEFREDWAFSVPISSSWNPTICYSKNSSNNILLGSSDKLEMNRLNNQPLLYVDNKTSRLSLRYRFIAIQHSITEREYRYWEDLERLNENLGTLFDPVPARIFGNLRNITNPGKEVLGFFTASSVVRDTLYVSSADFFNDPITFDLPYGFCNWTQIAGEGYAARTTISRYYKLGWHLADTVRENGILITTMANSKFCFDCTTSGSAEPPDDWIPYVRD